MKNREHRHTVTHLAGGKPAEEIIKTLEKDGIRVRYVIGGLVAIEANDLSSLELRDLFPGIEFTESNGSNGNVR